MLPRRKHIFIAAFLTTCVCIGIVPVHYHNTENATFESITSDIQPFIILNQGLGFGLDYTNGEYYLMDLFVAERTTGVFVQLPAESFDASLVQSVTMTISGPLNLKLELNAYDAVNGLLDFTDLSIVWPAGEYQFRLAADNSSLVHPICERTVYFQDMTDICVLLVPITALYNGEIAAAEEVTEAFTSFTKKVYPLGKNDLQWDIYQPPVASSNRLHYELNSSSGRYRVWKWLRELNYTNDNYDLIIGIVPHNMYSHPDAESASITGFTFGENISVISLDDISPSVTVAHEIGHCYLLGDEYENGMLNLETNMCPFGMQGRNMNHFSQLIQGDCVYLKGGAGNSYQSTGTLIYAKQYPFDIESGNLLHRDMTSFMGLSGYPESEYWVTTTIWTVMYHTLAQEGNAYLK